MHALVAFALGPIGRYVVAFAGLAALLAFVVWEVRQGGKDAALTGISKANDAARDAADAAARGPTECVGTWNREVGRCER